MYKNVILRLPVQLLDDQGQTTAQLVFEQVADLVDRPRLHQEFFLGYDIGLVTVVNVTYDINGLLYGVVFGKSAGEPWLSFSEFDLTFLELLQQGWREITGQTLESS